MKKALVLQQCKTLCPPIISGLKKNKIDFVYVDNSVEALKWLLEEKFDFIICCTETADEAIDLVKCLKLSSALSISTRLLVLTNNIKRHHQLEALLLGVTKFQDIADNRNFDKYFLVGESFLPSRILLVEDNQAIADMLIHTLQTHDHQVVHHASAKSAHGALLKEPFDLMVTDLLLDGNKTGQNLIAFLHRQDLLERDIPTLVITGYSNPALIVDLFEQGVADVAIKPIIPEEFLLRVERILKARHYQNQLEIQSKKLLALSLTDTLTGVFNRRFMDDALAQRMNDLSRNKEPFAVLMIDIDDFKVLNDQQGHLAGDEVLKLISSITKEEIRNIDNLCRFGGEEFVVILSNCDKKQALQKAKQLCRKIEQNSDVTVSIGLAVFDHDAASLTLDKILHTVDTAMYKAKKQGKNQVCQL